jgi:hypothetical protein
MFMGAAALAAAPGAGEHPVFDRAADRRAVAAPVGKYLLAANQGVAALLAAGDAVAGEHLAPGPGCGGPAAP